MNKFIDSIMANLPVLILLLPLYIIVTKNSNSFSQFINVYKQANLIRNNKTNALPNELKINACERLILFLERISPESLINRLCTKKFSSREFQLLLLQEIRNEFEHNLTQQLYLSEDTWLACENAKNDIVSIIHSAASQSATDADSTDLSKHILQLYMLNNKGIYTAKNLLKRELA